MIVEIYLDLAELTRSQSLVIIDDLEKRWDVMEALNDAIRSNSRPQSRIEKVSEVILERWKFSLGDEPTVYSELLDSDTLPHLYKQAVPIFRSLYSKARYLPAWKFYRRLAKPSSNQPVLKPKYRILSGNPRNSRRDTLDLPLHPGQEKVAERFTFAALESPAGPWQISVAYRTDCNFRIDDSEALLSSHFMGLDDHFFRPSLAGRPQDSAAIPGSAPSARHRYLEGLPDQDREQAYGSLSTFHNVGPAPGTSPVSAMRAVRDVSSTSPDEPTPQKLIPTHGTSIGSKPAVRPTDAVSAFPRRTSVSFQPFKAGSLASSPGTNLQVPPSPSSSVGRGHPLSAFEQQRKRSSLTTLPQQALRAPLLPNETAIASSGSSSPKPAPINRYSSSFSHRRQRFSSGGSKGEDDNNDSSGKASVSSSARQGSDVINDPQAGLPGSIPPTDDDHLRDFISLLEQKKDLKSFSRADSASRDASMRRTTAALHKYRGMRDSTAALSDSLSSSLLLHRSSSSSSRQLSAVPPLVSGTSASTSSSPGKPVSPHTHSPAVPSRLSTNAIMDYGEAAEDPRRSRSRNNRRRSANELEEVSSDTTTREPGTTAINIPTSPRPWPYGRRSSSASQQQRLPIDDENELFGLRSASLPNDAGPDASLSELLRTGESSTSAAPQALALGPAALATPSDRSEPRDAAERRSPESVGPERVEGGRMPSEEYLASGVPANAVDLLALGSGSGGGGSSSSGSAASVPLRGRFSAAAARAGALGRGIAGRASPAPAPAPAFRDGHPLSLVPSAESSASARGSAASGSRFSFGSRRGGGASGSASASASAAAAQDDDEPFIFQMSEIGDASRRSLEEAGGLPQRSGRRGSPWRSNGSASASRGE